MELNEENYDKFKKYFFSCNIQENHDMFGELMSITESFIKGKKQKLFREMERREIRITYRIQS